MNSATIIPIIRLPRNVRAFDYAIPDDMKQTCLPGTFVAIPFRRTVIPGLVTALRDGTEEHLKPIHRILPLSYRSWDAQRAHIEWFARQYCVSPASALKTLLPAFPRGLLTRGSLRAARTRTPPLHDSVWNTIDPSSSPLPASKKPILVVPASIEDRFGAHCSAIIATLKKKKNILLFFPTIHDIELFEPTAQRVCGVGQVTVLHSNLSSGLLFSQWAALFDEEPRCVLATRIGSGTPLHSLGAVIIDSAERIEHNQYDQNPRFDVRTLARNMQKRTGCSLIFSSSAPRLEECKEYMHSLPAVSIYRHSGEGSAGSSTDPMSASSVSAGGDISIVNMRDELRARGRGYISEPLVERIALCLEKKRGVFLFLNRTGTSKMISCRDCATVISCLSCGNPFRVASVQLICDHCALRQSLPARCPSCQSVRFHFIALGTEKITELMRKEFPTATVIEVTQQKSPKGFLSALHTATGREMLAQTIVVGTSFLPYSCPEAFLNIGLIGVLAGDPLITLSDFRSEERHMQMLFYLMQIAQSAHAQIMIQTFSPDQIPLRALRARNYSAYAQSALAERAAHGWPPATRLIRVRLALTQQSRLRQIMSSRQRNVTPDSDRGPGYSSQEINQITKECIALGATIRLKTSDSIHLTIPYSPHADTDLPDDLTTFLQALPNNWLIDIDPVVL